LEGLLFQDYMKNRIETHVLKVSLSSLFREPLEAILAHFGLFWTLEWEPKFNNSLSTKWFVFWSLSGPVLGPFGPFRESKSAKAGDQKWDPKRKPLQPHLRGPGVAKAAKMREW
jgi:hypothetical protein